MLRWREWIKEIVSLVNSSLVKEEDDIEEVFIHPTVSVKSALESLQVLSDFLSNAPAEFSYDRNILFKIRSLMICWLTRFQRKSKRLLIVILVTEVSIVIVI